MTVICSRWASAPTTASISSTSVGKTLRFAWQQRAIVSLDLYSALNADTVLTYNQTFVPGGQWLVPTSVLTARTTKVTFQYDF